MKVTLNWLKQYVAFDWTAEELAERLTMLGLEVEGIVKSGGEFEGIVVGEVLTRNPVEGSDKLSVCRVNDGTGERQVICGAQNFKAGDKVALILPGASLPAKPGEPPFTIKVRKVMGVESHGMLCSPRELGLAEDADGILILPPEARTGQSFAEHLGRAAGDVVFDLEVTPNRPDLNSLIGIAREIAAVTGNPLRIPNLESLEAATADPSAGKPQTVGHRALGSSRFVPTLRGPCGERRKNRAQSRLAPAGFGESRHSEHQQCCRRYEFRNAGDGPTPPRF
jgi:phenylalanyl-tRNA synthetase beta chain